jgi:hypothetical protein
VSWRINIITQLAGHSLLPLVPSVAHRNLFHGRPSLTLGFGWLEVSHDQFPDTLSIGPCAGIQDTPARTASDFLVHCTTPRAQLSRVLPYGVVVAIYGTAVEGSTRGESRPDPCAVSRRYVFSSIPKFPASPHSVILCMIVSRSPHVEQRAESVSRMVCSRSFVGRMSWITLNQFALLASATQVA